MDFVMGDSKKQESFDQYQYYLDFEYNGEAFSRPIFSENQLKEACMTARIKHAVTNAESLLQLEGKLVSEGELSHIRLYDKNMNLLASKD